MSVRMAPTTASEMAIFRCFISGTEKAGRASRPTPVNKMAPTLSARAPSMLTIHSVRVAVRGGVVNSEAIAGLPHAGLAHPRRGPAHRRQHRQGAEDAAVEGVAARHSHEL